MPQVSTVVSSLSIVGMDPSTLYSDTVPGIVENVMKADAAAVDCGVSMIYVNTSALLRHERL